MTMSPPRRRVLITGVTGTVARQLAEELLLDPQVEKVVGVDVGEEPYYFRDLDRRRFLFKRTHVLQRRELQNLFLDEDFRDARVDTVVHTAAVPPQRGQSLNVQGTQLLLGRCEALEHVRHFIYLSSWSVYHLHASLNAHVDERSALNFDENAPRLVQEQVDTDMVCRAAMDSDALQIAIVRAAPIVGRNISSPLNQLLESPFCPLPAGFDPMFNPIHARDVVRALHALVQHPRKGIFNIAGKDVAPLSFFTRSARCRRVTVPGPLLGPTARVMRRLRMTRFDERSGLRQLKYSCLLDTSRARRELGFEPQFHIKF
ncbi:MAG: NAD-dependent epimerase/dehydratase family protein [Myxococcota bacterium]